jgi:hypothetical protein
MTSLRIFSESASKSSRMRAATPSFSREAEQDVLGADVVVAELSPPRRASSRTFLAREVTDLSRGDFLTGADDAHDLGAHTSTMSSDSSTRAKALFLAQPVGCARCRCS